MGHGDSIVLADANFPAHYLGPPAIRIDTDPVRGRPGGPLGDAARRLCRRAVRRMEVDGGRRSRTRRTASSPPWPQEVAGLLADGLDRALPLLRGGARLCRGVRHPGAAPLREHDPDQGCASPRTARSCGPSGRFDGRVACGPEPRSAAAGRITSGRVTQSGDGRRGHQGRHQLGVAARAAGPGCRRRSPSARRMPAPPPRPAHRSARRRSARATPSAGRSSRCATAVVAIRGADGRTAWPGRRPAPTVSRPSASVAWPRIARGRATADGRPMRPG